MISLFALKYGFTKAIPVAKVSQFVSELYEEMKFNHADMIEDIRIQKAISEELTKQLKEVMGEFVEKFARPYKTGVQSAFPFANGCEWVHRFSQQYAACSVLRGQDYLVAAALI